MTSMYGRLCAAALMVTVGWANTAQAAPVVLEFSGVVDVSPSVTGVNSGDSILFKVFADNGGTGLNSQNWSWTDITSATIQAGTYSASVSGASIGFGGFSTDASGQLSSLGFGNQQSGTDPNGNSLFDYFMNGGNPIWIVNNNGQSFDAVAPPDVTNTSIALVTATPLPATLPLFTTGLVGLVMLARRRKRQSVGP